MTIFKLEEDFIDSFKALLVRYGISVEFAPDGWLLTNHGETPEKEILMGIEFLAESCAKKCECKSPVRFLGGKCVVCGGVYIWNENENILVGSEPLKNIPDGRNSSNLNI